MDGDVVLKLPTHAVDSWPLDGERRRWYCVAVPVRAGEPNADCVSFACPHIALENPVAIGKAEGGHVLDKEPAFVFLVRQLLELFVVGFCNHLDHVLSVGAANFPPTSRPGKVWVVVAISPPRWSLMYHLMACRQDEDRLRRSS